METPRSLSVDRLVDLSLPDLYRNLALDDALLRQAEEVDGLSCLRIWEQPTRAVVLGASGRFHDDVNAEACRADGVAVARRTSGGGTVLIGPGALNVAVVLPIHAAPELRNVDTAQKWVMGRFAESIRREGPAVEMRGSGDLAIGDRKVSGSAQRRLRRFLLIHATILYGGRIDARAIARYLKLPARRPDYRGERGHEDFVTFLPLDRERLAGALVRAWSPSATPPEPAIPWPFVDELAGGRLSDPAWIERF
jgi:lipoate-protein ligase A